SRSGGLQTAAENTSASRSKENIATSNAPCRRRFGKRRSLRRCLRSNAGLLLGEAMEGAEAPNQFGAIDGNDAARGEKFSERRFRDRVVRIVEGRKEDGFVCDVEVRVAGG